MRYSDFKIFRFDFVSLYCLIYKIAQDMNVGNTVFSQLMSLIPDYELRKCIDRYRGDFHARRFTCRDKGAFKMHTLIDVKNNIPNFVLLTLGNVQTSRMPTAPRASAWVWPTNWTTVRLSMCRSREVKVENETKKRADVECQSSLLLLFYFFTFSSRHARGDTQCRCDGRQHTNGCLDCEFPKCLVLHGKLRFKLEIRNEK